MQMHRVLARPLVAALSIVGCFCLGGAAAALAQQVSSAEPPSSQASSSDPPADEVDAVICTIDGEPVYRSEWRALLRQRVGPDDLDRADPALSQAVALTLVRRRLAMRTLRSLGGEALQSLIERRAKAAERDATRQGQSLAEQAGSRGASMTAWRHQLAWDVAWTEFVKQRLTTENLRKYFALNPQRDNGTRLQLSQIFIAHEKPGSSSATAAPETMQAIAAALRGASHVEAAFAEQAEQHSQAGSATQGGMIGWVETRGDLPPPLIDAALQAEAGSVIGPVRTSLGWHLLFLHQVAAGERTFDEIPDRGPLRRDATEAVFRALVRRQANAEIEWLDPSLQPPDGAPLVP